MKNKYKWIGLIAVVFLGLMSCKKEALVPTVKIFDNAISTSYTSANVTGEVTDEGSSAVIERGFIYGKQGEARQDTMYCGSGVGEFPTRLTGLEPNTTYNCFAFARNDGGIGKSGKVTFTTRNLDLPAVIMSEIDNIGTLSASCTINITDDGGAAVTDRGVCWSTNHNPSVSGSYVSAGSGVGEFTCNMTNLSPTTTYYVRAYAKNSKGVGYSEEKHFTTLDFGYPGVTTANVTDITQTSAKGGGNVTNDGGTTVTDRGICWSTSHNPTINDHKISSGQGTGNFTANITGLSAHTTYYVRAYATNSKGTAYGAEVSFNTSANLPTVSTSSVTNITATSAKCGGNVSNDGGATVTERGVCWSTSHNPTTSGNSASSGTGTGSYTVNMTGLLANSTYYVRAYAINSAGTAYGEEVTFTTSHEVTLPTLTTNQVTNITQTSATCGGNITNDGGGEITRRGICWSTHHEPTLTDSGVNAGTNGTGSFTCNMTGLTMGTTYYVRAFAKNSAGTAYGEERMFTTTSPTAPTGAINGLFSVSATQQVWFSQGNLQYKASTNTWRFATNQYDYIGSANSNISSSYSGWIDLFGWGTSGWNCGNTYYRPWDSYRFDANLYGPPGQYNLTGSYINSDWGYYNSISNGGNMTHQWRTLTQSEWNYVFNTRSTASGIRYAKAQVNNINGVILLPDNWNSSYYNINNTNNSSASFSSNVISSSTWTNSLQSYGAVFLPSAGWRDGTTINSAGTVGSYWSTSFVDIYSALVLAYSESSLRANITYSRHRGASVRLICPAN